MNTRQDTDFNNARITEAAYLNAEYHLNQRPSILYLEVGDAPFYLRANSACRYTAPLVLVRNKRNWNLTNLPEYWEEYNCAMNYRGKFIVMETNDSEDWFGDTEPSRQSIMQTITRNYTLVRDNVWRVWERKA